MKTLLSIFRITAGALFIFSGLIKAIDPRGLAYKMEEFFQVWAAGGFMPKLMGSLETYALSFSVVMITLEVVVGVALLLGFWRRLTVWLLFLLMLFFTFLTAFVLFTGKIKACGCFGDCVPLTPVQTFTKDIILLIISLVLLIYVRRIVPRWSPRITGAIMLLSLAATLFLQWWVLNHLPLIDCLPYKKGNNIAELRKMPADAVPDKFDYIFLYEKNGKQEEFKMDAVPDSTWTFVDRKQVLVQAGKNNIPVINDFSLTTESGTDSTDDILGTSGEYWLLFERNADELPAGFSNDVEKAKQLTAAGKKVFVVTSRVGQVKPRFAAVSNLIFLACDATVIKTAARVNPTLYKMNGPVVQDKSSLR